MFNRLINENVDTLRGAFSRAPRATKAAAPRSAPRRPAAKSPAAMWGAAELQSRGLDPYISDLPQKTALKSISLSREMVDFINDGGSYGTERYSEIQLENAYRTSYYLYAALKKVARMVSTVPVVAEGRIRQSSWVRLPETHPLNLLISNSTRRLWFESYLFWAMFGAVATYKERTPHAVAMAARNTPVYTFPKGAVAGLHVIPNANWQLDETAYGGEVKGITLTTIDPEDYGNETYLPRERFIFMNDFDPRDPNRGVSVVSMAINSAVTNAAIQRFAAHYFMSGAMPMLLVQPETDDPDQTNPADMARVKNRFEEIWRGIFSRFSLRSMFVNRRYKVDQVGIKAEDVNAPELNTETLKAICSVVGIAPDMIIPPDGGSDNARHKSLIKQALTDTVIPFMHDLLSSYNDDLGLSDAGLRLVVAEDQMPGLEADRADAATTETSLWSGTVQSFRETRVRVNLPEEVDEDEIFNVGGKPITYKRLLRDANSVSAEDKQYYVQAWTEGVIRRSELRQALGLPPLVLGMPDGFKYEVVPDPSAGGGGFGGGAPEGGDTPPELPPGGGEGEAPDDPEAGDASKDWDEGEWMDDDELSPWDALAALADLFEDAEEGELVEDAAAPEAPINDTPVANETPAPTIEAITTGTVVEPTPPAPAPIVVTTPGYVYLSLANEDQLVRVQERLKAACPAIELSDPATLHLTLAYAENVDDAAFNAACALTPDAPHLFSLRVERLTAFDAHDGKVPVVLEVDLDMRLSSLQTKVRTAFQAVGVGVSEYTVNYNPHITLGYCPAPTALPQLDVTMGVTPSALCWAREDYNVVHRVEFTPTVTGQDPQTPEIVNELRELTEMFREKFVDLLRMWQAKGEAPRVLPPRIREWVGEALQGRDPHVVFVAAMRCAQDGTFDDEAINEGNPVVQRLTRGSMQDTPEQELAAWEKSARNNYKKAAMRFETKQLPAPIAAGVRAALKSENGYNENVKQVFTEARAQLATYEPPQANEDTLAEWAASIMDDPELRALVEEGDEGD